MKARNGVDMEVFKRVVGWIFLPIKFIFELLDPILRFVEMAINIPLAFVLGNLVDLINAIPTIGVVHVGELILGILAGIGFGLLDAFVFHLPVHITVIILICIGVAIVGYFISYLFFKFVVNFVTSLVSLICVFVRLAIYLPGSIWLTVIKVLVPIGIWCAIFFSMFGFWTSNAAMITYAILLLLALSVVCSVVILLIRGDTKFHSLGVLGDVTLTELSAFTHSIGLYVMTLGVVPVYIGRAIEFNNGGLRKRIRDYQRGVNTHSSGTFIQEHLDELKLYVIELGHTGEDVDCVKEAEESLISNIYTKLNKVDASVGYVINILGYLAGAAFACTISYILLGLSVPSILLMTYAAVVAIVCIVIYFVENKEKWA